MRRPKSNCLGSHNTISRSTFFDKQNMYIRQKDQGWMQGKHPIKNYIRPIYKLSTKPTTSESGMDARKASYKKL